MVLQSSDRLIAALLAFLLDAGPCVRLASRCRIQGLAVVAQRATAEKGGSTDGWYDLIVSDLLTDCLRATEAVIGSRTGLSHALKHHLGFLTAEQGARP